MTILIATQNLGKMEEFRALLGGIRVPLVFPPEIGLRLDVPEVHATYQANAVAKAAAYCGASGMISLADDSGLEVDALDGAPGVRSARYTSGGDEDRVAALLAALHTTPLERRTARFRCAIAIVTPWGETRTFEGTCEGMIALSPSGRGGFGYDPVFYLPTQGCTMASLTPDAKNRVSHRARALQIALPWLRDMIADHDRKAPAP